MQAVAADASSGGSTLGTLTSLQRVMADLPASLARVSRQPEIKRETDYFLATVGSIKSLDAFMQNDRVYQYATRAFGMQDIAYAKAFVRRLLSEGIDAPGSLANRLSDPRFAELVRTFNFSRYGSATTSFSRAAQGTADLYVRQALEAEAGRSNEGVRLALTFMRKASAVTTPYSLLADRAMLKVTQVALGLPASMSVLDIDRQAEMIQKRFDVSDLKNQDKLDKFLTRFAALWEFEQPAQQSNPALAVLSGGSAPMTDTNLLAKLQNLRKGS